MALNAGEVIGGRFRLEAQLGAGAFGAVWRASDTRGGPDVALKILHDDVASHKSIIERFQLEASILEELDHPNIARAVASGKDGTRQYFAMELVEGRTLREDLLEVAKDGGLYPVDDVITVLTGIASGLERAHRVDVVHRDVKPSNIMVARKNGALMAKVLDFGIAKVTRETGDQTTVGRRLGTLSYMSPEQLVGETIDARSDIFALGVLLFEMLTARRPFLLDLDGQPLPIGSDPATGELNSFYEVTRRITLGTRPRASRFRAELSVAIDEVLQRAMHPVKEERFASSMELLTAVERALERPRLAPRMYSATAIRGGEDDEAPAPMATVAQIEDEAPLEDTQIPTDVVTHPMRPPPRQRVEFRPVKVHPLRRVLGGAVFVAGVVLGIFINNLRVRDREVIPLETHTPPRQEAPAVQARVQPEVEAEIVPVEIAPEKLEDPKKVSSGPKPQQQKKVVVEPPAAPSMARRLLAELEAAPNDARVVNDVAQRLQAEAEKLSVREERIAIQRCATMSMMRADAKELAECIKRLPGS